MLRRHVLQVGVALVTVGLRPLLAHEDEHVEGTIAQVTLTGLSVKQRNGRSVSVTLAPSTKVTRDGKKASVLDLKAGMAVVVDAHEDDDENLVAVGVKIVPPPAGK